MAEKEKLYKFEELSKEAKERAIEQWREKGYDFDNNDAQFLTEDFKEILKERGFYDPKVYWSLGYCQGDGVCFEGTIEASELFKQKGFGRFKELTEHIGIRVRSDSRMCHSNSMDVEVEFTGGYDNFIDRDTWYAIREIERKIEDFGREHKAGAFEWAPGMPEMPAKYNRVIENAKKKEARLEKLSSELEEKLKEWVEDLSRELEKIGYAEIEYKASDEAIVETFEANDYEFTEEGDWV